jgi:hypothetical protein
LVQGGDIGSTLTENIIGKEETMEYVFYIIGFLVGVILFLYALSFYESGKERIKKKLSPPSGREERQQIRVNPQSVSCEEKSQARRERICPLCRAVLTRYEALYASQIVGPKGKKILIYGCRYCYKPEEDPDERKQSQI